MATLDQAIDQMLNAGMPEFPPGHPKLNVGAFTRYGPKSKAFYKLYEHQARNGKFYVYGTYGIWGVLEPTKIATDYTGMEPDEHKRLQDALAERERREKAKRGDKARNAARRAEQQWSAGRAAGDCPYLVRKGLMAEGDKALPEKGLRVLSDGTLLVPMVRYDVTEAEADDPQYIGPRRLAGLQKIAPDGSKKFNAGMTKEGTACRIGRKPRDGQLLIVGEGLATVLSAHLALDKKYTLFVAFDSGNLMPVARILRTLYPKSPILFLGDDDAYLEAYLNTRLRANYGVTELFRADFGQQTYETRYGPVIVHADFEKDARGLSFLRCGVNIGGKLQTFQLHNPGMTAAWAASAAIGNAWVCAPEFSSRVVARDPDMPRVTDFNDLQATEGIEAVRRQMAVEVKSVLAARELADQLKNGAPAAPTADKGARKAGGGGKGKAPPPRDDSFDWDGFCRRFTYVWPTDGAWDAREHCMVKVSVMRLHFGDGIVKWWMSSASGRRTVNIADVVFDPTGKCDLDKCINIFDGIESKPSTDGSCEKIIALLQYLCGEEGQDIAPITDWVLKWIAYPLQNVGTKMASAVVMHGPAEGTGKNLFWGIIKEIYGRYGSLITQSELEAPYNAWLSQRLFMIANEVVSRAEMRHHVGRLKNFVTEPELPIREIYMPIRYEKNYLNMVFLTNELQALLISPYDRRYMVIRTPQTQTEAYYLAVLEELKAGGRAAFHRYLLDLDLGDFSAHTKPLHTAARDDLIDMGLGSAERFWTELHEGLLYPVEYGPALTNDMFALYSVWCARNGVKNPRPSNHFSHEFMAMNGVKRGTKRVPNPDDLAEWGLDPEKVPQRRVFVIGAPPEGVSENKWLADRCKAFRAATRQFASENVLRRPDSSSGSRGAGEGDDRPF